jgi:DNA-binding response OmpR family regulator
LYRFACGDVPSSVNFSPMRIGCERELNLIYKMSKPEQKLSTDQRKILVVEDSNEVLQLITHQVRNAGFIAVEASDAESAKVIVEKECPSIVICDWMMPGEDGLTFCKYLRQHPKTSGVYFIMLTARGEPAERLHALKSGVDDYIIKPFGNEELRARIAIANRICELQSKLASLERAQAFQQMGNTIAHEINNPLTGLLGFLQLTRSRLQTKQSVDRQGIEKLVEVMDRCIQQAHRISEVVDKLRTRKDLKVKDYGASVQLLDIDSEKT